MQLIKKEEENFSMEKNTFSLKNCSSMKKTDRNFPLAEFER